MLAPDHPGYNKIIEKLREKVQELQRKNERSENWVRSFQKTIKKRKSQNQLDDHFKRLVKEKNPELYKEIVKELMDVNINKLR